VNAKVWPRAVLTVALRGAGKYLLLASGIGWIVMGWLVETRGDHAFHSARAAIWLAMILAMAPPLLLREIGHLWRASLRRRRRLTIATFLCGYVGTWLIAGIVLSALSGWFTGGAASVAVAAALVGLWHCSPARQRRLNACHRVAPLRVFGVAALWDSLRYGISTGGACAAACGPIMLLALLVTDHHLFAMAVASVAITIERHAPARRPRWKLPLQPSRSLDWAPLASK
jgi:hypothetical protein